MGPSLRAVRALFLLAGFYLLSLLMLAVLAAADWAAGTWTPGGVAVKIFLISAVLAIPIVRGMFMLRTPKGESMPGVRVDDTQEPELWRSVRDIAQQVGTRAPDEIVLTGDVNAAVSEDARFLGLVGGARRLYLGLPLMTGLSESQLRAVLAHEMGHYVNADTRLTAITVRGRVQVLRTIAHFQERAGNKVDKERAKQEAKSAKAVARGRKAKEVDTTGAGVTYRAMAWIYTAYAKFYMRATLSGSRRAELAADVAAARIAGRDATASALREIPVLDSAHGFYMDAYATLGVGAGLLPPSGEVFGGVRHLLAARREELEGMRADLPEEPSSPYDSHPAIAERVARIEALPDDGRASEPVRPSMSLLADPGRALAAVEQAVLTPEALAMRRVEWPELVHVSMTAYTQESADGFGALAREAGAGDGSLPSLLDAIDSGGLWRVAERLPKSQEAASATGRAAREFARPRLTAGLAQLVRAAYVRDGRARWELSWSDSATLKLPDGHADELPAALEAAVADVPDTTPLRKLLIP
ncbi:M48 family metallopeptidase [Streptomyces sp. SM10]|uniref:M48 family metallopeptidase n=1 Tax=Streptomyces sp. SM10 TaxID=565556 RepID=UPI000CD511B7|nr:M48 family metallopeptidase [Streptomyces sp. SM10]